ncbi:MAG: polyphosphate kinase 2 family protein, partial [Nakamurella sp.]
MGHRKSDDEKRPVSTGDALRMPSAKVELTSIDAGGKPVGPRDKHEAARSMKKMAVELAELQEKLSAAAIAGGARRILLVLQG